MKTRPLQKKLFLCFWIFVGVVFFSYLPAHADIVYQQSIDGSQTIQLNNGTTINAPLGSFTTDGNSHYFDVNGNALASFFYQNQTATDNIEITISTNATTSGQTGIIGSFGITAYVATGSASVLAYNINYPFTLQPYTTYYLSGWSSYGYAKIVTGGGNMFGFITDSNGDTLPPSFTLPGVVNIGIATTTQQQTCANNFQSTGLLDTVSSDFAIATCNVITFLFIPNTTSLNTWNMLASSTLSKFPFSWIPQTASLFSNLTASSTQNLPQYTLNMNSLGLGSTSPMGNILPSFDALSSTTVMKYIPTGAWQTVQDLMSGALWLGFAYYVFNTARNRFARDNI